MAAETASKYRQPLLTPQMKQYRFRELRFLLRTTTLIRRIVHLGAD
jgi:hypothetical protein